MRLPSHPATLVCLGFAPRLLGACSAAPAESESLPLSSSADPSSCTAARLRVYDESPGVMERLYVELPHRLAHSTVRRPYLIDTGLDRSYRLVRDSEPESPASAPEATLAACSATT